MTKGVIVILVTVLMDAMGIGIMIPVLPQLLTSVLPNATMADASLWGGTLATIYAVMQFVFSPILGMVSDQVGRKPVLLVSLFFMIIYYLIMAVAGSVWFLLFGRIIGGITAATHSTASAYMADISAPHEKAARFGLIGAAFGMGFVLGPALGGLLGEWGARAPFYAAACLALINTISCALWLRESVTDDIRKPMAWRRANPFGAFAEIAKFANLGRLLLVFQLFAIGTAVYAAIWPFFTAERFQWSSGMIGLSLTAYGISFAVVQGALVRPIVKKLGEERTVVVGFFAEIFVLMLIAFMTNGVLLLLFTPISALGIIGQPLLQAIRSKSVGDKNQGTLQGVISSMNALAMIIAPVSMSWLFYTFSGPDAPIYFPGIPFLVSSILVAISWVLFMMRKSLT